MKKKKIVHILNTGKYSGAENVAITIIKGTESYCDSVYVSLEGSIEKVLQEKHINFFSMKKMSISNIRQMIKIIKPDIIHAHDFTTSVLAFATFTKIPIISHLHNNSPWIKKIGMKSIIYGISCLRYRTILTVSESIMNEYIFGRVFRNKTYVIGNPVDIYHIREKAKIKGINETYDIAFIGRLSPQKSPMLFIDIISEIVRDIPELKVCMIGDGELRDQIEEKIRNMDLDRIITIYGFQKNPYCILNNAKLLCMPSMYEGFGLAAVEALTLGKPVVCSGVGGLSKIVNNTCGKLCSKKDEYVDEIEKLLNDKEYYSLKEKGANKRALDMHNIVSNCK